MEITTSLSLATPAHRTQAASRLARVVAIVFLTLAAARMYGQSASPVSVTPSSGSGSAQLFSASSVDFNGASDVQEGVLNIMSNVVPGTPGWSANECLLRYDIATNNIWLVPDAGGVWSGPVTSGTTATLGNSQCTVIAAGSFAQLSGNTATVNFLVTFTGGFAGAKQLYLEAEDVRGNWSTNFQQQFGSFSVSATASPLGLVPLSGSGNNQTFTAVYYNPNGGGRIAEADLYVMSNVAPGSVPGWSANECIFQYDVATNNIWQVVDGGGSYQGPIAAGSSDLLSNSQCTIFGAGSSAQVSGNTATVNFSLAFTNDSFAGGKQLYLGAQDTSGNWATNFQQVFGSWIIPSGGSGPVSIPNSYTAADPTLTCDNIAGQWVEADNFGNSVGWDLTQSGNSVSGTLSFDDYRGGVFCGTITYTASGTYTPASDGSTGQFSLMASQPNPSVDNCGLPLAPSETDTVTLSGTACGGGSATFNIDTSTGAPSLRAMPRAALQAAQAQASNSSTWSTNTPRFSVQYASYIPVDNIHGPTPCSLPPPPFTPDVGPIPIVKLYKGDAFRGTYRTSQSIFVVPDKQFYDNFVPNAGPTRNYGAGSPLNGSTLSSAPATSDIYNGQYVGNDEDNIQFDCTLWNDRGKADLSTMQGRFVSFPTGNQAQINLNGLGQDPLEFKIGGIKWNANITIDDSNASQPTATVNITHTCYPAHTVKVNGMTVYDQQPLFNNTVYLLSCLTFLPQVTRSASATVPNH